MQWITLLLAGIFEITWATTVKMSDGFTKLTPSLITAVACIASFSFLSIALKRIPLGTAYAIWTGIGIIGTSIKSVFLFKETLILAQIFCIALIATGIIGLKLMA